MNSVKRPAVGVGVLVFRDGKLLLGERRTSHGAGTWTPPGGHLELNETPEACAQRETGEEAGIQITNLRRGPYTNDIFEAEGKHYLTLFIVADYLSGDPRPLEPEKTIGWKWFDPEHLPAPLFLPLAHLIEQERRLPTGDSLKSSR